MLTVIRSLAQILPSRRFHVRRAMLTPFPSTREDTRVARDHSDHMNLAIHAVIYPNHPFTNCMKDRICIHDEPV